MVQILQFRIVSEVFNSNFQNEWPSSDPEDTSLTAINV